MGIKAIGNAALDAAKTFAAAPAVLLNKTLGKDAGEKTRTVLLTMTVAATVFLGAIAAFATAMMVIPGFAGLVAPATGAVASLAAKIGVKVTPMLVATIFGPTAFAAALTSLWFAVPQFAKKPSGNGAEAGATGAAAGAGAGT